MTSHRTVSGGHAFPLSRWKIRSESALDGRGNVQLGAGEALVVADLSVECTLRAEVGFTRHRIGHDDLSSVVQTGCLHF